MERKVGSEIWEGRLEGSLEGKVGGEGWRGRLEGKIDKEDWKDRFEILAGFGKEGLEVGFGRFCVSFGRFGLVLVCSGEEGMARSLFW